MNTLPLQGFRVVNGEDRAQKHYSLGIGVLSFKVTTQDSQGRLLMIELAHWAPGGPARHFHREQDEWFYVAEGEYIIEVGGEQFHLSPGDSAFSPRKVTHAWAHVDHRPGRLILALTPAGQMEPFLIELGRVNSMAPQEPAFWHTYGMELVGPPLAIEAGKQG